MPTMTPYAPPTASTANAGRGGYRGALGDEAQGIEMMSGAVKGYGELLKPELMQQIGTALGGLNGIGALRSGASVQALGDIGTAFTDRVASYAATTAAQGAQLGLDTRRQVNAEREATARKRAALLGSIGSVLGAGIGFIAGGPAGAAAGAKAGGSLGGAPVPDGGMA